MFLDEGTVSQVLGLIVSFEGAGSLPWSVGGDVRVLVVSSDLRKLSFRKQTSVKVIYSNLTFLHSWKMAKPVAVMKEKKES